MPSSSDRDSEPSSSSKPTSEFEVDAAYDDLRALARSVMSGERAGATLQPTALAHEALLRIGGLETEVPIRDRAHFLSLAALSMRRILVDAARRAQHPARPRAVSAFTDLPEFADASLKAVDLLALDESLENLGQRFPRARDLVELRFFVGLDLDEVSEVLEISESTTKREWRFARAWLLRRMKS